MRSRQLRATHATKSSEPLSLQPVSQRSRGSIRFVRQRSPQRATDTWWRHQHQNLYLLRDGVTRVLRALWFDVVLVTTSRRICRLGFNSTGHARHTLLASKAKTRSCRLRSPLVHAIQIMSPDRLTASRRERPFTTGCSPSEVAIEPCGIHIYPPADSFNPTFKDRTCDCISRQTPLPARSLR